MANKIVARLNWGAFNHAFHAPQLRSCNYYIHLNKLGILYMKVQTVYLLQPISYMYLGESCPVPAQARVPSTYKIAKGSSPTHLSLVGFGGPVVVQDTVTLSTQVPTCFTEDQCLSLSIVMVITKRLYSVRDGVINTHTNVHVLNIIA